MTPETEVFNTLFGPEKRELRKCSKCHQKLPLSEFSPSSGAKYLRAECRNCNNKLSKETARHKKYIPKPKDHICPICLRTEEECLGLGGKTNGAWCLDHDHTTNEFRGWLCHQCNRGLGFFKDDVERLERAIRYLQRKVMICESED